MKLTGAFLAGHVEVDEKTHTINVEGGILNTVMVLPYSAGTYSRYFLVTLYQAEPDDRGKPFYLTFDASGPFDFGLDRETPFFPEGTDHNLFLVTQINIAAQPDTPELASFTAHCSVDSGGGELDITVATQIAIETPEGWR